MFRYIVAVAVLGVLAAAGCNQKKTPEKPNLPNAASEEQTPETKVTGEEVKNAVGQAVEKAGEFADQQKEELVKSAGQKIDDLQSKIEELKEKGKDLTGEAKENWEKTMDDLQKKRENAREELKKLKSASGDTWKEIQKGAKNAWNDLEDAYQKAADQLKK